MRHGWRLSLFWDGNQLSTTCATLSSRRSNLRASNTENSTPARPSCAPTKPTALVKSTAITSRCFATCLDRLGEKLLSADSLAAMYQLLHSYPLMGDFMSYQVAIDLNYSPFVNFSENDFVIAGPGTAGYSKNL
ncbi:MAG TPA: nucleotide kinase domain-containing protein [Candidatus Saccharimonadales bacterium]|jgi:hypothetical protein